MAGFLHHWGFYLHVCSVLFHLYASTDPKNKQESKWQFIRGVENIRQQGYQKENCLLQSVLRDCQETGSCWRRSGADSALLSF